MQGRNRLHLSALDKEHYCVTVHLAQQRSEGEVRDMMRAPETAQEALKRVQVTLSICSHDLLPVHLLGPSPLFSRAFSALRVCECKHGLT